MNTPPLSQNFDIRLERLNREIRQGLDEVRRRIHELERVEESTRPGATEKGSDFGAVLRERLEQTQSSPPR